MPTPFHFLIETFIFFPTTSYYLLTTAYLLIYLLTYHTAIISPSSSLMYTLHDRTHNQRKQKREMRSSSPNIMAGTLHVDDKVVIMYHPFLPEGELVYRAGEIGTLKNISAIEVKGTSFSLSIESTQQTNTHTYTHSVVREWRKKKI